MIVQTGYHTSLFFYCKRTFLARVYFVFACVVSCLCVSQVFGFVASAGGNSMARSNNFDLLDILLSMIDVWK